MVRDAVGDPCVGSVVEIDFCSCSGQQLCSGNGDCGDGTTDKLVASTDASGTAIFAVAADGTCDGSLVDIVADGVLLAQREPKPMDVTGNFIVEPDDFANYTNPANDYNCDGVQNLLDLSEFGVHVNRVHSCESPVGVLPGTWGTVKASWK